MIVFLLIFAVVMAILTNQKVETIEVIEPEPEIVVEEIETDPRQVIIGTSVEGRAIESYTFGDGVTELVFVGGMHGG